MLPVPEVGKQQHIPMMFWSCPAGRGLYQNDSTADDLDLEAGKEKGKQKMEDNTHKRHNLGKLLPNPANHRKTWPPGACTYYNAVDLVFGKKQKPSFFSPLFIYRCG